MKTCEVISLDNIYSTRGLCTVKLKSINKKAIIYMILRQTRAYAV